MLARIDISTLQCAKIGYRYWSLAQKQHKCKIIHIRSKGYTALTLPRVRSQESGVRSTNGQARVTVLEGSVDGQCWQNSCRSSGVAGVTEKKWNRGRRFSGTRRVRGIRGKEEGAVAGVSGR
jgi:hypothetical protein